jgi:hypothetical protein
LHFAEEAHVHPYKKRQRREYKIEYGIVLPAHRTTSISLEQDPVNCVSHKSTPVKNLRNEIENVSKYIHADAIFFQNKLDFDQECLPLNNIKRPR